MQSPQVSEQCSADHDVVEMRDDKVSVAQMDIDREGRHKQTSHAANCEQTDKAEAVEHRSVIRDGSFVQSRGPVKDFDCRRNRDGKTQERKDHPGVNRLAGDKQVMSPDQKTKDCDGET